MDSYRKLYIDGRWTPPLKGGAFDTVDPASETVLAEVAAATAEDVDLAVHAAQRAFEEGPWRKWPGERRAEVLRDFAQRIRNDQERLARLAVRDNGKPLAEAEGDISDTAGCFDYYAGLAEKLDETREHDVSVGDNRFTSLARKEPIGPVGAISPWNYPMLMEAWKVAPALAAGCTVVLKPSELAPLLALELAAIAAETELPDGVLNVVTGLGPQAGAPLANHPGIAKLAFTGSVPTGIGVANAAANGIKNVTLELGGKSPLIVFDDCDIDEAVEWAMFGIFWNQGEVCSATSRILVQRPLYQPLLKRLAQEADRITVGNGLDPGVLMGPIVSRAQYGKVMDAISRGIDEGARLVTGGSRPQGLEKGFFVRPTIFSDVPRDSWIWTEEIFGPVACVRPFDDEAGAVREANDSRFGLAAAVMSKDPERCNRVARELRAGIVWINCSQPTFTEAPWGGYKQSGTGRELGQWGLNNYLEVKQITSFNSGKPWGWYLK